MKEKSFKKKIIIVLFLLFTLFCTSYSLAKYNMAIKKELNLEVAIPIITVDGGTIAKITNTNNVGYYDFTIKNYNKTKVSDVPLKYRIEIISNENIELIFKLYNGKKEIELKDNKTEQFEMQNNEKMEHNYRLKVLYNKNNITKDIIENVKIKVIAEQINR